MLKYSARDLFLVAIAIAIAIAFSLALYRFQSPEFMGIGYDREIFRYIGMVIHQGGVPYRDVLDHKPPLIYFVASVSPSSGPVFFYWTLAVLSTALAIVAFLLLAAESFWAASVVLAVFIIFATSPLFVEGGGLTRQITAPLVFLTGAIYYSTKISLYNKSLITGFLSACIFLTQQNEVLLAIPFIVGVIVQFKKGMRTKAALLLVVGSTTAILPFFTYLHYVNIFYEFIRQSILINTNVYIENKSLWERVVETWASLRDYQLTPAFLVSSIWLLFHLAKRYQLVVVPGALLVLTFMNIAISGKHYGHYKLSFAGALAVSVWAILVATGEMRYEWRGAARAIVAISVLYFTYPFLVGAKDRVEIFSAKPDSEKMYYRMQAEAVENAIKDVYGQRGQFYSLNNAGLVAINADMQIIAPTRFIYQHFWGIPAFEKMFGNQEQIVSDLERYRTKYLAHCNGGEKISPALDGYVKQHYKLYSRQISVGCDLLKRSE